MAAIRKKVPRFVMVPKIVMVPRFRVDSKIGKFRKGFEYSKRFRKRLKITAKLVRNYYETGSAKCRNGSKKVIAMT